MINKKYKVQIPSKKGIIIVGQYVYFYTKTFWNKETKHTDDDRVTIGKISDVKGYMHPNERFFEFFADALEEAPIVDDYLKVGPYLATKMVSDKIGLTTALDESFSELSKSIIALSTFAITMGDLTAQHYDNFAFSYFAGLANSLSSGTISKIYKQIKASNRDEFYKQYASEYRKAFKIDESKRKMVLAIDGTNRNTSSKDMIDAEYGHSKKKVNSPQVNTTYYVDELTGIPLYQEEFYGSLLDKSQLSYMVNKSSELGFNDIIAVLDRGYYSEENIDTLKEFEFILSVPETVNYVKELFKKEQGIKMNRNNYIHQENAYGIKIRLTEELSLKNYFAYIYYDPVRGMEEIDSINNKIERFKCDLNAHKHLTQKLKAKYEKYFSFIERDEQKHYFIYEEKKEVIQEAIDKAGMFLVISNIDDNPSRILTLERCRDKAEKCFYRMKTTFDYDAIRVYTNEAKEGKDLVAFVATSICQGLQYFLSPYLKQVTSRTLFTCLSMLSKIIVYKDKTKHWKLRYALSKQQKEILKLLDIKESEIVREVNDVFNAN